MPSVLVELGFISNPEEEDYLNSASGQQEAANCIFKAIKRYKDELGRYSAPEDRQAAPSTEQPNMQATPISYNTPRSRNNTKKPVAAAKSQTTAKTASRQIASSEKSVARNPFKYDVQLLVSDKKYTRNASIFNKLRGTIRKEQVVMNSKKVNKYKYIWGSFKSRSEANAALRQAKQLGFRKATLMGQDNENVQLAAAKSSTRTIPKVNFKYDVQLLVTDKRYTRSAPIFKNLRGTIIRETVVINRKTLNKYVWVNFKTEKEANTALSKAKKAGFWNASLVSADNNRIASR
jgi:hypothetical protein